MEQQPANRQFTTPSIILAHFLRQVENHHVHTPTRTPLPLHYDSRTKSMTEYAWPCNPDSEQRIPPSELEAYRRTHKFRGPCCLCAFLNGKAYTEARIGIVEVISNDKERSASVLHGEYVATCASQRCGYFLCLERFYTLVGIKVQDYPKRTTPLHPQELAHITDIGSTAKAGVGLCQVMSDTVVRGKKRCLDQVKPDVPRKLRDRLVRDLWHGIPEERFWHLFVQCLLCKDVVLREGFFTSHKCGIVRGRESTRYHPYGQSSERRRPNLHIDIIPADLPQSSPLASLRSLRSTSPAATEIVHRSVAEVDHVDSAGSYGEETSVNGSSPAYHGSFYEVPSPPSSTVLPSVIDILRNS